MVPGLPASVTSAPVTPMVNRTPSLRRFIGPLPAVPHVEVDGDERIVRRVEADVGIAADVELRGAGDVRALHGPGRDGDDGCCEVHRDRPAELLDERLTTRAEAQPGHHADPHREHQERQTTNDPAAGQRRDAADEQEECGRERAAAHRRRRPATTASPDTRPPQLPGRRRSPRPGGTRSACDRPRPTASTDPLLRMRSRSMLLRAPCWGTRPL